MAAKAITIFSVKGGTGKTTVTIALAKALTAKGFKIGLMDSDVTGAKLPTALGIPKDSSGRFPLPVVDVSTSRMYPMKFNGFEVFSEAFIFGENPLTWHGGDQKVIGVDGKEVELEGTGIYSMVKQNLQSVTFSPDLDYILYDMPPSSSDPALSLFENLNIYACILVCQPTSQSVDDIKRSISMLRQKKVPLLGMVGNMAEAICPHCQKSYYPFVDKAVDLREFCEDRHIPYLVSIPFTSEPALLESAFTKLADMVVTYKPIEIWKRGLKVALEQGVMKKLMITTARKAASEG
jgi:ATP-binding protein involved in chromosome partitioning